MSADNGIYILVSPELDNGFFTGNNEYRVAHCQAIENVNTGQRTYNNTDIALYYEVLLFGNSEIFKSKSDALKKAEEIYNKIMESDFPIIEYGIQFIYINHPFPEIPKDEARKVIRSI